MAGWTFTYCVLCARRWAVPLHTGWLGPHTSCQVFSRSGQGWGAQRAKAPCLRPHAPADPQISNSDRTSAPRGSAKATLDKGLGHQGFLRAWLEGQVPSVRASALQTLPPVLRSVPSWAGSFSEAADPCDVKALQESLGHRERQPRALSRTDYPRTSPLGLPTHCCSWFPASHEPRPRKVPVLIRNTKRLSP